jgi:hypothetical protein
MAPGGNKKVGGGMPPVRRGKKTKPRKVRASDKQVDAFGENVPREKEHGGKHGKKKTPKGRRSVGGFLVAAVASVATLAWALVGNARHAKKSEKVLQSMRKKPLHITEHASCRMDCRFVTRKEILQSLFSGRVNMRKSNPQETPCPKYVVDAEIHTAQGRRKTVQTVFSACPTETRVVTTIDTSTNWPCGPC